MKSSRLRLNITIFVVIIAGLLGFNVITNNTPILGLDLQGGLSVIYRTTEPATDDDLIVIRDLMRGQLEDFGITEPDVRVEGENIIVDLPGVSDQESAFGALDVSGIVTLRPVLACQAATPTGSTVPGSQPDDTAPTGTQPATTTTDGTQPATTDATPTTVVRSTEPPAEESMGFGRSRPESAPVSTDPTDTEPSGTAPTSTAPTGTEPTGTAPTGTGPQGSVPPVSQPPAEPTGQELLDYPNAESQCLVGPSGGSGEVFEQGSAEATINPSTGAWMVNTTLRPDGAASWNALASQCFNRAQACPSSQLAIVLDDEIQSAPTVNEPNFPDDVSISGAFSEGEARSLARVLNRGAFPVQVERERVETVSPTAGHDSLNAALIAGLLGVAVTMVFMIWYYRKLSVIIVAGLIVWGMTVFSLASFVSQATNYALTLAGATGIIVSIGVAIDSYVVLFERVRDEMRAGRTLANAGPRSFAASWRTILSANITSLIGSVILFALSVGSVKGFALYLGLTTICGLIVCYLFIRPAILLLGRSRWFDKAAGNQQSDVGPQGALS